MGAPFRGWKGAFIFGRAPFAEGPVVPVGGVARSRRKPAGKRDFPATIVTARGDKKTGTLAVKAGSIEVAAKEDGALRKMSVAIADIDSIEITHWRSIERRRNEFAFYPDEMKITLRDKKVLLCTGMVASPEQAILQGRRREPFHLFLFLRLLEEQRVEKFRAG